jgi:hypothetical protein
LAKLLNVDSLSKHNVSIMNKKSFCELFLKHKMEKIYCDYVGIFSFGLFNTNLKWKYFLHRLLLLSQRPFDFLLRIFMPANHLKNKYTSPYLLFIGLKK